MKTIPHIFLVLLFAVKFSSCGEPTWENGDTTQETIVENTTLRMTKEEEKKYDLNLHEGEVVQIVLKEESHLTSNQTKMTNDAQNITQYWVKEDTKPPSSLEASDNSNSIEGDPLIQIVLKDCENVTNKQSKHEVATESLIKADATTTAAKNNLTTDTLINLETFLTTEPLISSETFRNLQAAEQEMIQITVKDVTHLAKKPNEIEDTAQVSTESLAKVEATATVENDSTTSPLITLEAVQNSNLAESELIRIVLMDMKNITNHQKEDNDNKEISTESSGVAEDSTTTPQEDEETTRPSISIEEYAVKQMNFILDHLLGEMQDFVAKVLEANVNTVFPKDQLKRYAEDINRLLNTDVYSDYSNEVIKNTPITTAADTYEKIVKKLSFLKSKSTKLLQKTLPPGWINDYRHKKSELTIWLDKATEEMHTEFNGYVTEEEDHLKHQYFNETFDDIARATELQHKLALLADLVTNVKNKKPITFMDLYMQT